MASTEATTAAPSLSLEEVLHVLLVCFDAAVDAFPQAAAAYALLFRDPSFPVAIWKFCSKEDLENNPPGDLDRFTFLPPGLNDALTRINMCDWFCLLLEWEVDEKIGELLQGRAQWLTYWPKIDFVLSASGGTHQPIVPLHSVLFTKTGDGREMIMDGTLRQFLRQSSTWLQTWEEWSAMCVDKQDKRVDWWFLSRDTRDSPETAAAHVAGGFWCFTFSRLTILFKDLDWEELRSLGAEKRIEHAKRMVGERFVDLREEAFKFG
jgi:hypothetical protein